MKPIYLDIYKSEPDGRAMSEAKNRAKANLEYLHFLNLVLCSPLQHQLEGTTDTTTATTEEQIIQLKCQHQPD